MKVFLSGIGGIGMSAYAQHMRVRGHEVSGSDAKLSSLTKELEKDGIAVTDAQDGSAVPEDCELLVYSEAVPADAPERTLARERGVPEMSYFQALGELTAGTDLVVVTGTHGKSSVTAMAAKVFLDAGRDPNVVVGTRAPALGNRNWRASENDLWIVEGCEYRTSFLHLQPKKILLTNVDHDHHDAFPTEESYVSAFGKFLHLLPQDGTVFFHGADERSATLVSGCAVQKIDVDTLALPELSVPGRHMRENAQLALALALSEGISEEQARISLQSYEGSWRRFEEKGTTVHEVPVIDDYAHHPAEIRATIAAAREKFPDRRIVCAFQPHTHERTHALRDEFASSFRGASLVVIPNVYDARPRGEEGVDLKRFGEEMAAMSETNVRTNLSFDEAERELKNSLLQRGDVLLVMGAGDITALAARMTTP